MRGVPDRVSAVSACLVLPLGLKAPGVLLKVKPARCVEPDREPEPEGSFCKDCGRLRPGSLVVLLLLLLQLLRWGRKSAAPTWPAMPDSDLCISAAAAAAAAFACSALDSVADRGRFVIGRGYGTL